MEPIKNFSTLAANYDAFFLDLWGVVHDGSALYAGARECLQHLHQLKKKVVLISNAPRRAAQAVKVLDALGVDRAFYQHILTSGEAAFLEIKEGLYSPGINYYFIGSERDSSVLDGLDLQRTSQVNQADFLLNVGFGTEERQMHEEVEVLEQGIALGTLMLCLNPDLEVVKMSGEVFECAGVYAKRYQQMGGKVDYFGKPYGLIYERAHRFLERIPKSKILGIGDGLHTDIEGANRFGIDSLLITGGILKGNIPEALPTLNQPTYVMSQWVW